MFPTTGQLKGPGISLGVVASAGGVDGVDKALACTDSLEGEIAFERGTDRKHIRHKGRGIVHPFKYDVKHRGVGLNLSPLLFPQVSKIDLQ